MRLDWPDCANARDVGGLATVDGGRIRPGALLRSDNPDRLTAAGVAAVRASGVRRILDLRWTWESAKFPNAFTGDPLCVSVPFFDESNDESLTFTEFYLLMTDRSRRLMATAFAALAQAPSGPVLVHCNAGADRTGILVALALSVAGVSAEDIRADYALSPDRDPDQIGATLDHLDTRYGGVVPYLLGGGATESHVESVRARLRA